MAHPSSRTSVSSVYGQANRGNTVLQAVVEPRCFLIAALLLLTATYLSFLDDTAAKRTPDRASLRWSIRKYQISIGTIFVLVYFRFFRARVMMFTSLIRIVVSVGVQPATTEHMSL